MMWRRSAPEDSIGDMQLRLLLRQNDPASPPTAAELAALENRIMAQIESLPDPSIPADLRLSPWMTGQQWLLGGAAAGVLFIMLGFSVGRNFDDLFSQADDSISLFASADNMSLPPFVAAPSSMGESDDTAE